MHPAIPYTMRVSWKIAVVAALLALAVIIPARANAAVSKASSSYYQLGQTAPVYGLTITGYDGKNVFVAVRASYGTVSIPTANTTGLTLAYGYSAFSGQEFAFTGPVANANVALASLQTTQPNRPYVSTPSSTALDVGITLTVTEAINGLSYYPANQHFYQYVPATVPWSPVENCVSIAGTCTPSVGANALAQGTKQLGQTGYLASITDADENAFVASKIQGEAGQPAKNVWIGASDLATEGAWIWNGGPENGVSFWQGCNAASGGAAVAGRFSNWADGEPNNWVASPGCTDVANHHEDCAVINKQSPNEILYPGLWNDLPCTTGKNSSDNIKGYIVEFGNKAAGGDYAGVDIVSSTLRARPNTNPKVVTPNFFERVFTLLFASKRVTLIKKKPKKPATFTFTMKLRVQTPGTYIVSIKRPDGKGSPFQFQPKTSYRVTKNVATRSGRWTLVIATTKENQEVTIKPVLKTTDWVKPKNTKLFFQLRPTPAAIHQICWVGWCQGTSIPVPKS